jgi:hypothetical protein
MSAKFITICVILILSVFTALVSCNKEEPTAPVSFDPPGIYRGYYMVVYEWMTNEADTAKDSVTVEFKGDGSIVFDADHATDEGRNVCDAHGTYIFIADTLKITFDDVNFNNQICDGSVTPEKENLFLHYVDHGYLVFEIRDTDLRQFFKLEFKGN